MTGTSQILQPGSPDRIGRVVVNLVGEPVHGLLAESRFVERSFLPGGEHNMYELAFAAAASGYEVELRGWLERRAFARLRDAVGVAPEVGLPARMPSDTDLVIVPEGWRNPLEYARLLLSPARLAIFVLAAPGLFGWPFGELDWSPPDPLTVRLDDVGRPDYFQTVEALGFELVTHSPGIAAAARAAGVRCALIGIGRPDLAQLPAGDSARPTDVAALLANRWEPLVRTAVRDLSDLNIDLIDEAPNDEVLRRLSRARVLLWPSRIEGHATIPWEARSVGCVPVALSSNRFAVGLDDAAGAVLVDHVEDLSRATRELLSDERRWAELSARAARSAREEVDWDAYVRRVQTFLGAERGHRSAQLARGALGASIQRWEHERAADGQRRLEELKAELERVQVDRGRIDGERAQLATQLAELRDRRAVRTALRIADARHRLRQGGSSSQG